MRVSVGVEEEFHVVGADSRRLVSEAPALLRRLSEDTYTPEFRRSVIETNSAVHATLDDLHRDLRETRSTLADAADALGLAVVAAGTVPLARAEDIGTTSDHRYAEMARDYRLVADEQLICGAQVHIDVPDRDTAVRAMSLVSPWLPVLLALTASSPFWLGADTGYASWRTLLWQRWPTAGPAGHFASAAEYDDTLADLVRSGVISDAGMVYYDVRPSAHQRTLELRIADACPRTETVVLVAGLFRALVVDACEAVREDRADEPTARTEWLRAATWRAARSGLEGPLVDPLTREPASASDVVHTMLSRLRSRLESFDDWATVNLLAHEQLARGSEAHRLRRYAPQKRWVDAVSDLIALTRGDRPPTTRPRPGTRTTSNRGGKRCAA
ncbi:carboxylate-amine ligase [Embleya scabrispora]|uniref:carboxylate-amine ligase n=1 Tax=Embleya scabrispora TaxID=159449 RepID=UPI0003A38E4A|nr:glutamate--cysteine ligase [Embleya scabrispora]MYS80560.1 YbdK family carboxylate-amine ligase [Streptomyces sp. SID5474]